MREGLIFVLAVCASLVVWACIPYVVDYARYHHACDKDKRCAEHHPYYDIIRMCLSVAGTLGVGAWCFYTAATDKECTFAFSLYALLCGFMFGFFVGCFAHIAVPFLMLLLGLYHAYKAIRGE